MIEVYGSPVSNCYNTVLAALCHKQVEYRERHVSASMDSEFRHNSPMGKIPFITHGQLALSETSAILEYLDEVFPGSALFPGTAELRGRQRQLMKFVELYVESPSRRLFPGVFWAGSNEPLHVREVRPVIERGMDAVQILLEDHPKILELSSSAAAYYLYLSLSLVGVVTRQQYQWELTTHYPLVRTLLSKTASLPDIITICAQRDAAMQAYLDRKAAAAKARTD
tara:strand:+ start:49656 stop:50330 length:675 start_codon:yes stop_codon:yes gene_type:complete